MQLFMLSYWFGNGCTFFTTLKSCPCGFREIFVFSQVFGCSILIFLMKIPIKFYICCTVIICKDSKYNAFIKHYHMFRNPKCPWDICIQLSNMCTVDLILPQKYWTYPMCPCSAFRKPWTDKLSSWPEGQSPCAL